MSKKTVFVITALLSAPVLSLQAEWLWEDKPANEQEFNAEQNVIEAKSNLKDIRHKASEDKDVVNAQARLKKAEIELQEAREKAGYATKKAKASDTIRKDLSSEQAVEKSKIEFKDAKAKRDAEKTVRKAQDKVAKAKAHLNKSITEANYAAEQVK